MPRFARQFTTFSRVGSAASPASNLHPGVVNRRRSNCSSKYSPHRNLLAVAPRSFQHVTMVRVATNEGLTNGNDAGSDGAEPHLDARATRSGRSLRSQHGSVEPEDEAVH